MPFAKLQDIPEWVRAAMQDAAMMADKEGAVVTAAILKTALGAPDAEKALEAIAEQFRATDPPAPTGDGTPQE